MKDSEKDSLRYDNVKKEFCFLGCYCNYIEND